MKKFLFLFFPLLVPVRISQLSNSRHFYVQPSHLITMAPPPPGGAHSRMNNNFKSLKEGATIKSEKITHNNGNTTEFITITITKKK